MTCRCNEAPSKLRYGLKRNHLSLISKVMLGLGTSEIMLILCVVLLFFGAKKLPELARGLGNGIREFKDATGDVKKTLDEATMDK